MSNKKSEDLIIEHFLKQKHLPTINEERKHKIGDKVVLNKVFLKKLKDSYPDNLDNDLFWAKHSEKTIYTIVDFTIKDNYPTYTLAIDSALVGFSFDNLLKSMISVFSLENESRSKMSTYRLALHDLVFHKAITYVTEEDFDQVQ